LIVPALGLGLAISDVGGGIGFAIAVAPEPRVAGAEHEVIGASATEKRLMEIIAQGEPIG
jgi:hypothetical protein